MDLQREELTEREEQVVTLLACGLRSKQIAAELGITWHTVKFHTAGLLRKLGAKTAAHAVALHFIPPVRVLP